MITNVEALKVLYKKLGGSLTDTYSDIAGDIPVGDYVLISDCILACAKKGAGGGSDLPTPGTAGNVLTSTGSAWESAAPTDNDFVVEFEFEMGATGFEVSTETSISAINAAANAGKNVKGVGAFGDPNSFVEIPLVYHGDAKAYFSGICNIGYGDLTFAIDGNHNDADEWTIDFGAYVPVPAAADYAKVLKVGRVSDGQGGYTYLYGLYNDKAPLIVHGTISNGDFSFTDTTVKDVYDAKVANRAVFLDDDDGFRWELTSALLHDNTSVYSISFGCLKHGVTKIIAAIIGISGTAETTTGGGVIESDLTPNT